MNLSEYINVKTFAPVLTKTAVSLLAALISKASPILSPPFKLYCKVKYSRPGTIAEFLCRFMRNDVLEYILNINLFKEESIFAKYKSFVLGYKYPTDESAGAIRVI